VHFSHACVLPRVFNSIVKHDVGAIVVQSSKVIVNSSWVWQRYVIAKDSATIAQEPIVSQASRSHWVGGVGLLEEAPFSAVLPGPLAYGDVTSDQKIANSALSVIIIDENSGCVRKVVQALYWVLLPAVAQHHFAEASSVFILNSACEDIGYVIHEIANLREESVI